MKVLIDNGTHALHNVGDIAMLQVAVRRLNRVLPNADIYVFSSDQQRLQKLIPDCHFASVELKNALLTPYGILGPARRIMPRRFESIALGFERSLRMSYPHAMSRWSAARTRCRNSSLKICEALEFLDSFNAVVCSGGGYITDCFPLHTSNVLEYLRIAQSLGKKTAMFGQGLGPVNAAHLRKLLSLVFTDLEMLALREGLVGPRLAEELSRTEERCFVTGDDAIELAQEAVLDENRKSIGFCMRVSNYSEVGEQLLIKTKQLLDRLTIELSAPVQPLPICLTGEDSDFDAFRTRFKFPEGDWSKADTPRDVIQLASTCRIVITGAYHAAVFALSMGIPVVCLVKSQYYFDKFSGLQDQFTANACRLVRLDDNNPCKLIEGHAKELYASADDCHAELTAAASRQAALSDAVYQRFAERLLHA